MTLRTKFRTALFTGVALAFHTLQVAADAQNDLAEHIYNVSRFSGPDAQDFFKNFSVRELRDLGFEREHSFGVYVYPMQLDGCDLLIWDRGKANGVATLIDLQRVFVPHPDIFGGKPTSATFQFPHRALASIFPHEGYDIFRARTFDSDGVLQNDGHHFPSFTLFNRGAGIVQEKMYNLIKALDDYQSAYCEPSS
jgi:hypothetical protein